MTSMFSCGTNDVGCATPFIRKSMTLIVCPCAGQRRVDLPSAEQSAKIAVHAYTDNNPKGFGLLQLDRDFSIIRTLWAGITNAQVCGWNR